MDISLDNWRVKNFLFAVTFILIFLAISNYIIKPEMPVWQQFIVLTLLPAVVFSFYFGQMALDDDYGKMLGLLIGYLAFDIFSVPHLVNTAGVIDTQVMFGGGTTDALLAGFFQGFGIQGSMLYIAIYVVSPAIGILVAVSMLSKREFYDVS
jgi:hypothetical protein